MWSRTRAAADTRKGTEKGDPTAQVPFALRADDKVEVIGHQVVAENIQKEPGARVDSGTDKGALVPGLVKDNLSTIDTIEDVRPPAADGIAVLEDVRVVVGIDDGDGLTGAVQGRGREATRSANRAPAVISISR
jgi:hypothetical protein